MKWVGEYAFNPERTAAGDGNAPVLARALTGYYRGVDQGSVIKGFPVPTFATVDGDTIGLSVDRIPLH